MPQHKDDIEEYVESMLLKKRIREDAVGNTTGNIAGYDTPNAFASSEEEHEERSKEYSEMFGYKKANPPHMHTEDITSESSFMLVARELFDSRLHEGTYKELRDDETRNPRLKVNTGIKEIAQSVRQLEQKIGQYSRLKKESGVHNGQYWTESRNRLRKISERLNRISHILKELGS